MPVADASVRQINENVTSTCIAIELATVTGLTLLFLQAIDGPRAAAVASCGRPAVDHLAKRVMYSSVYSNRVGGGHSNCTRQTVVGHIYVLYLTSNQHRMWHMPRAAVPIIV